METFSVLLAICAGNSPVPGEFPAQRPVTHSLDVFFDLRPNNGWVNNGEAGDLRHHRAHYDVIVMGASALHLGTVYVPHLWADHPSHCVQPQCGLPRCIITPSEVNKWPQGTPVDPYCWNLTHCFLGKNHHRPVKKTLCFSVTDLARNTIWRFK